VDSVNEKEFGKTANKLKITCGRYEMIKDKRNLL